VTDSIIGLYIGGTKCAVVEGTFDGGILAREVCPTRAERGWQETFDSLCAAVGTQLRVARASGRQVVALSVSIGGPLDTERGIIYSPPNLPGWDAVPLKDLLTARFGVPAYVQHDGAAGALAEWWYGAGHGAHNLVFLTMGTGLGAGLILNGRVYRGATGLAGEVGHIRVAPDGPEVYGKRGSWEGYCAGPAFARLAAEMYPQRWGTGVTTPEVVEWALSGDADALAVVRLVGDYLGQGLAVLVDLRAAWGCAWARRCSGPPATPSGVRPSRPRRTLAVSFRPRWASVWAMSRRSVPPSKHSAKELTPSHREKRHGAKTQRRQVGKPQVPGRER